MSMSKIMVVSRNNNVPDLQEELRMLVSHVHAQTMLICGEGLDVFCNQNDEIKSNYLWAISDATARALSLIERTNSP